jgi:hypothetical protein
MKTTFTPKRLIHHSGRLPALVCGVMVLLGSLHPARAVIATFSEDTSVPTNVFNVYTIAPADGIVDGTDGAATVNPSGKDFSGLPASGFLSAPTGLAINGYNSTATYSDPPYLTSSVSFNENANPTLSGLVLSLNNSTPAAAELRIDWFDNFTVLTAGSLPHLIFNITGNCDHYYAVAGTESVYDVPQAATYVCGAINNGFTPSVPGAIAGTWYGASGANPAINAVFDISFTNAVVNVADEIQVTGFIDLIVDPGTVQVQIQTDIPPLGISTYGGSPVVLFPTATGTNYSLQMTTNLVTGTWSPVTNGVPFTGIQITNATSPVFFRLH